MAGLSFIDVDLGKAAPLVGVAVLGLAVWYVWHRSQQDRAQQTAAANNPLAMYQAEQDMAWLKSISGASSVQSSTTHADPLLPAYSAPGNPAQNFTTSANLSSSLGTSSTTSNGIV